MAEPVLVFYRSAVCGPCRRLSGVWDSVKEEIKKKYPNVRHYTVTAQNNTGKFDPNVAPADLINLSSWFPMLLLIPGALWNEAMDNLGPKNPIKIRKGVHILNGKFDKERVVQDTSSNYNPSKASDMIEWIGTVLEDPEFQNDVVEEATPIQPLINNMPTRKIAPVLPQSMLTNTSSQKTSSQKMSNQNTDICSLRLISRQGGQKK